MEDAVPSTAKHGMSRGLPLKEVLEYVVPEVNIQCLRMAISSPKVPEQLLKLDQQGVSTVLKGLQTIIHIESVENVMLNTVFIYLLVIMLEEIVLDIIWRVNK